MGNWSKERRVAAIIIYTVPTIPPCVTFFIQGNTTYPGTNFKQSLTLKIVLQDGGFSNEVSHPVYLEM